jgi:hypothetical protein
MSEEPPLEQHREPEPGLFKRYPKLSIIIIAVVAYGLLLAMCAIVGVLLIRG